MLSGKQREMGVSQRHSWVAASVYMFSELSSSKAMNLTSALVAPLPALMNHNFQSDATKPINRQTLDAGYRDFTVSGHVDWMKGQTTSPVDISTITIYCNWKVVCPLQWLLLRGLLVVSD